MEYSVPDKRDLREEEKEFLQYIFEKEKPEWTSYLKTLKVIARCGCGKCPGIMLAQSFTGTPYANGDLLIDYIGQSSRGDLIGISVFANNDFPCEVEFYSIDGESDISSLPGIDSLRRFGA